MNGHGGARLGAGRPRKPLEQKVLEGTASVAERRAHANPPPIPPVARQIVMPADLSDAQRLVWEALAPHAIVANTLTPGTAFAFRELCELIVVRRGMLATIEKEGWQRGRKKRKHPLASEHRGLLQREEAGLMRFRIAPVGKEMEFEAPATPEDPFDEFDGMDPTPQ